MASASFQQFYWGDYLRDTMHLTTEEHGAYLLLIAAYWTRGRAPEDDDQQLAAITRMSLKKWKMVRPKISRFFEISEGHFFHFRIEEDLEKFRKSSEKNRENGAKGGRPGKPKNNPVGFQNETQTQTQTKAISDIRYHSSTYPNGQVEQRNSSTIQRAAAQPEKSQNQSRIEFPEIPDDQYSTPLFVPNKPEIPQTDGNRVGSPLVDFSQPGPSDCQIPIEQRPRPAPRRINGIPEQLADENRQAVAACLAAAGPGLADPAKTPSLHLTAARITAAMAAGCDLESDIIPVIQARTANQRASPITTWSYFETAWIDQRDKRLAGLPAPDPTRFSKEISHAEPATHYTPRSAGEQRETRHRAALRLLRDIGALDGSEELALAL